MFQGATEGTLLWTLNSIPGVEANTNDHFVADFSPSQGNPWMVNATGGLWADLGTIHTAGPDGIMGTADDIIMTGSANSMFLGGDTPNDGTVDWRVVFTGKPDPTGQFLVLSDDPIDTVVIPEPVTMASLFLGIGCLSRYIRKRR